MVGVSQVGQDRIWVLLSVFRPGSVDGQADTRPTSPRALCSNDSGLSPKSRAFNIQYCSYAAYPTDGYRTSRMVDARRKDVIRILDSIR